MFNYHNNEAKEQNRLQNEALYYKNKTLFVWLDKDQGE